MSADPLRARYPDPPPPVAAWVGWRRKKDTSDGWEPVAGTEARTKGGCYEAVMRLSELVGHEGQWEYQILPVGDKPAGQPRWLRK